MDLLSEVRLTLSGLTRGVSRHSARLISRVFHLQPRPARARFLAAELFEMMPSSPIVQAWRNMASPCSADRCSEKRSTGPPFLSAF